MVYTNLKGFYLSGSTNFVFTGNTASGNGTNFECDGGTCDASPDLPWNINPTSTAPSTSTTPYITASTYLNATSPTGRTLNLNVFDLNESVKIQFSSNDMHDAYTVGSRHGLSLLSQSGGDHWHESIRDLGYWQVPLPADFPPGTYSIDWDVVEITYNSATGSTYEVISSSSTTVTISALSTDEEAAEAEMAAAEASTEAEIVIPSWIKQNAEWWSDGSISDRVYVGSLQWLITNGVMVIG